MRGEDEVMTAVRPWCAKAQFPGLKPFIGGTVPMPSDAKAHEVEDALRSHFLAFLPPGFDIIEVVCGSLFFVPAKGSDD